MKRFNKIQRKIIRNHVRKLKLKTKAELKLLIYLLERDFRRELLIWDISEIRQVREFIHIIMRTNIACYNTSVLVDEILEDNFYQVYLKIR